MYLCNICAPENTEKYHVGQSILGICENDNCEQRDFSIQETPIRNYVLRIYFEDEEE
jgi:hypothetical protein